ncbi:MAG TPA: ABC transporter substrate-binding protein [Gaiellaceae bacterium]|nr:ABC transporter substrate-binding protein [Gaiellaceae bacterium]
MGETQRRVDEIRKGSSELENHLVDEYAAGKITRRDFVRRGTVIGLSLPTLSFLAAACGGDDDGDGAATGTGAGETTARPQGGGALRTGIIAPAGDLDPNTVADEGGLAVLGQSGEYLTWSDEELMLQPRLAEEWTPNEDGSVWTFTIRSGVTFHDDRPLTTEDVAATMNRLADPDVGSNALSVFGGVLSPGNVRAVDDTTVEFTLDAPNGNFPYLVSSDNYNAIILPADYDTSRWTQDFLGTGPWILDTYTPDVGVTYRKNPNYWDQSRQPLPDTNEIKFYAEEQARVLALQGGEIDAVSNFSVAGGGALLEDPNLMILEIRASQHRQIHMRTDREPFDDRRVRQAMALLLDRQALVDGLWEGRADLGNDSPFAPVFPSTDTSVEQREQDVEQARALLAEAGREGFEVELRTWDGFEIPDLAALVQDAAQQVGITVRLNITDPGTYYGDAVYGKSPWLDSTFGITDYGHRGVPNVLLTAPLTSKGPWNSAHFKNPTYDRLVADYAAALDLDAQRAAARQIQELLLEETPIIFPYFYFHLGATTQNVAGIEVTGMGHVDVSQAGFTS